MKKGSCTQVIRRLSTDSVEKPDRLCINILHKYTEYKSSYPPNLFIIIITPPLGDKKIKNIFGIRILYSVYLCTFYAQVIHNLYGNTRVPVDNFLITC